MSKHRHNAKIRRLPPCTVACPHTAEALEQVLRELSVRFKKIRCKCGTVAFSVLDVPPAASGIKDGHLCTIEDIEKKVYGWT